MMSKLISRLMFYGMVALLGLGVLAVLIWYYGPLIRIGTAAPLQSVVSRIVTIVIIFAIYGLFRLFKAWRDKKKSAEISNDLASSEER